MQSMYYYSVVETETENRFRGRSTTRLDHNLVRLIKYAKLYFNAGTGTLNSLQLLHVVWIMPHHTGYTILMVFRGQRQSAGIGETWGMNTHQMPLPQTMCIWSKCRTHIEGTQWRGSFASLPRLPCACSEQCFPHDCVLAKMPMTVRLYVVLLSSLLLFLL